MSVQCNAGNAPPGCEAGIYGLMDVEHDFIFYVGRSVNIEKRALQHRMEGVQAGWHCLHSGWLEYPVRRNKLNCLAYLWLEGVEWTVVLLEPISGNSDAQRESNREGYWARHLVEHGHPLANGNASSAFLTWQGVTLGKAQCPYTAGLPEHRGDVLGERRRYPLAECTTILLVDDLPRLRRLRAQRPDLHTLCLERKLTPHSAMIEAGFLRRTLSVPLDPQGFARAARKHLSPAELAEAIRLMQEPRE